MCLTTRGTYTIVVSQAFEFNLPVFIRVLRWISSKGCNRGNKSFVGRTSLIERSRKERKLDTLVSRSKDLDQ